jgi:hypothetical protein
LSPGAFKWGHPVKKAGFYGLHSFRNEKKKARDMGEKTCPPVHFA